LNFIPIVTKGVERPNMCVMSVAMMGYISTTRMGVGTDTTILSFLKANHPGVTFDSVNEFAAVSPKPSTPTNASSSANILAAYSKNADKITLEIPQPFEQLPVQQNGLAYEIACHARCAGIISPYPMSVNLVEVPVSAS
jgi:hypothetical protein